MCVKRKKTQPAQNKVANKLSCHYGLRATKQG
uniref:Uncharacterized protein n=1 Tax=Podoviridae sp. ctDwO1 TaxID=2827726 RepID=A0A8S5TAW8_9CAUD|nr:MAG TPA: hypothetical protein [Podoviridae sp. ctDwO1]